MATKTARSRAKKAPTTPAVKDEAPPAVPAVLEPANNPIVEGLPPAQPPEFNQADQKAAAKAREKAAREAEEAAKERAKADEKRRKDEEKRTVHVRATRRGQYPAAGKIRNPGEEFDYVLARRTDGTLEEKLPTWMVHVDGDMKSRVAGEPSRPEPEPLVLEVRGVGKDATVTAGGRSVL